AACLAPEQVPEQLEHTIRFRLPHEVCASTAQVLLRGQLAASHDRDAFFVDEAGLHRLDVAVQDRHLRLGEDHELRRRIAAGHQGGNLPPCGLQALFEAFQKG